MAGGQGTRFWPYSTESRPKQFLKIVGRDTLINQTFLRLRKMMPARDIYIIADKKYLPLVKECIPDFSPENFIAEPSPKNTAPCLILANIVFAEKDPSANILVVPADHYIPDVGVFARQMGDALSFADSRCIVTAGIKPHMPHTGYGYIHFDGGRFSSAGSTRFYEVLSFKEKPELAVAEGYVTRGTYLWNSGMFIYNISHFADFLREYSPYYHDQYSQLAACRGDDAKFAGIFNRIKPDSIDFALMEKVKEVRMFEAEFAWNDVGAWLSVYELNKKDGEGNVAVGDHAAIDTEGSLLFSTQDCPIAAIGVRDLAVIHTENGILVAPLNQVQRVKDVLQKLK